MRQVAPIFIVLFLIACDKTAPAPKTQTMDSRSRLMARIGNINDLNHPRPLVTLAEFFEGNNDWGSIGYNLAEPLSPQEWHQLLRKIASRPEVRDVRIEVKDLEDADGWPSTDTIWFITTASPDVVRSWLPKNVAPSDVIVGFANAASPIEAYEVPSGYSAIGLWYD